jgi:hypothetical protein
MKINRLKSLLILIAAASVLLAACGGTKDVQGECEVDADCSPGFYCGPGMNCLCLTDLSCADDEYCNPEGFCQKLQGCRTDTDCGDEDLWRCMISGEKKVGECLCKSDLACESDEFCNTSGSCQKRAGCMIDEDCGAAADWACVIDPATQIGQCLCSTDNACEAGEFCNVHGYCQPVDVCTGNDDCPTGQFCDIPSGECLCDHESQTGCGEEEICNTSGYCQPRPGCYNNVDCEHLVDHYCDITTRTCVPEGTCNSDRQCPLGQVCRQHACVDGCNDNNDCPLSQCCNNFLCESCGCQGDEFCDFMHFCVGGQCQNAYSAQTPYCLPCDNVTENCGDPANRCLIYPYDPPEPFAQVSDEYCAVDCAANERCPNGFNCSSIIVIKQTDICRTSADCPGGLPCLKSPEEDQGACPCSTSNPCPTDLCLLGSCINKKIPCNTSADCLIECELYSGVNYGGCVIGKNCGLKEGFHCPPP